ncbi:dienelactone hydrolase family protein [Novosphingobium sp. KACC 22771]|uniref:dienelactone hydrolase family protein n=1 Tax=Novosphingobium sp. KACC 22771 TaxID=3025670 RepID=UPI0023661C7B|nr:dienelactone hydrolase family protein [Novosphingobium sp. KACC 22771]WDF71620.1 dienelactone hydrolase family protein [Novosphingobium sp. KACC 22771]
MMLQSVSYSDGDVALTGWVARPASAPRAAILIWPTIANVGPAIEARAAALAEQGYLAFVGDFYGAPVASFEASFPMAAALRGNWDGYRTRLHAALSALRALPGTEGLRIGVIGYCMGGQAALELARDGADIAAAVSFHGVFDTEKPAAPGAIKARILVLHGDADPLAPRSAVIGLWEELDAAGANWHFHSYANVRHGFTDPESDARGKDFLGYNTSADRQSWAAMLSFFDEIFA